RSEGHLVGHSFPSLSLGRWLRIFSDGPGFAERHGGATWRLQSSISGLTRGRKELLGLQLIIRQPRLVAPRHRWQALGVAGFVHGEDAELHVDLHRLPGLFCPSRRPDR